jgi:hypothetical protein
MPRAQFSLKTLLWLTAVVAASSCSMQYRVLWLRATERQQELERMNRGLTDEIQSLVLRRARMQRKIERLSKKLRDDGTAQAEIDMIDFRE